MTDTKQIDLEGNPLPDVKASVETVEYRLFESDKFRLRARRDRLEETCLKNDDDMISFVQRRIRLLDKDTVLEEGDFDTGVQKILRTLKEQDQRGWDAQ